MRAGTRARRTGGASSSAATPRSTTDGIPATRPRTATGRCCWGNSRTGSSPSCRPPDQPRRRRRRRRRYRAKSERNDAQPPLGKWVSDQRKHMYLRACPGAASYLNSDHAAALNTIGFDWDGARDGAYPGPPPPLPSDHQRASPRHRPAPRNGCGRLMAPFLFAAPPSRRRFTPAPSPPAWDRCSSPSRRGTPAGPRGRRTTASC